MMVVALNGPSGEKEFSVVIKVGSHLEISGYPHRIGENLSFTFSRFCINSRLYQTLPFVADS